MSLPQQSGFGGKLGRELNAILEELRSLRPVPGPGNLFGRSSMGTYRTNGGGSRSSAATTLTRLTVVNVLEDALECSDDLGVTVTHTVMKPQPMRMSDAYGYVGFDDSILDALESSNTWPWTTTVNGEYTTPVFMRAGPDSSAIDTIRAVQQRYRLVYVPSGITPTLTDGRNRVLVQEMVWPPYYATGGAANGGAPGAYNGGGFDSYPLESTLVLAMQDDAGIWHEVLPARQWVDVNVIASELLTETDSGEYGRVTGTKNTNGVFAR